MIEYTAGFAFSGQHVLLIRKTKPEWQAGKLNAIGGKIEKFDHDQWAAQAREFWEETGLTVPPLSWKQFDRENFEHGTINWFFADNVAIQNYRKTTEEQPEIWSIQSIINEWQAPEQERTALYNLPYLLAKAVCFRNHPEANVPF